MWEQNGCTGINLADVRPVTLSAMNIRVRIISKNCLDMQMSILRGFVNKELPVILTGTDCSKLVQNGLPITIEEW